MANFSQLRRQKSSREICFRAQFSGDSLLGPAAGDLELGPSSGPGRGGIRPRSCTRVSLRRQLSEAPDQDEMGSLMWEMRPRRATTAGEMRRRRRAERDRDRETHRKFSEDGGGRPASQKPPPETDKGVPNKPLLEPIPSELELPPSRVSSVSQFSQPPDAEDGEVREAWDSKFTFILATIGYAVGLGNIWRFPYLAQKNGGGAFLIPYWIMLFAEGLPIFLLELAVGQRLRKGSLGVWNQVSPYLGGIGIASGVVSFNVALYYNTIIAWCLRYFMMSFWVPLPWASCPQADEAGGSLANTTTPPPSVVSELHNNNNSELMDRIEECEASSPTAFYWYRNTLDISTDIETADNFNWFIAGCLVAAWLLVYLCMIKGITENPKIIYITSIFPYAVLIIFFFRGITLPGMEDGILHFIKPKWERLADPLVWLEAGTQIFFSLGLAFGGLIAYSSYNPVNNNCTRDALIVAFTNCCTSMFAGVVIFSIMGFKAHQDYERCLSHQAEVLMKHFDTANITVPESGLVTFGQLTNVSVPFCSLQKELDNSASGTGLAFILFTEAVNQFPWGNVWALLFFLMLFTLGLDSQFGTLQGVIQCIIDLKVLPDSLLKKEVLTGIICSVCLLLSLSFSHGAGSYIFTLFDNFAGSIPLLVIALFECLAIAYKYGLKRFSDDIELMTGSRPSLYWLICWKYISPLAMLGILTASVVDMAVSGAGYDAWNAAEGITYQREWPTWCKLLIGVLIGMAVIWIPLVALLKYFGITLLSPSKAGWFPAEELRLHYELGEHKVTSAERVVFGYRDDGTEGILCPTKQVDNVTEPTVTFTADADDDEE